MVNPFLQRRRDQRDAELVRLGPERPGRVDGSAGQAERPPLPNGPMPRSAPSESNEAPGISYLIEVVRDLKRETQRYRAAFEHQSEAVALCALEAEQLRFVAVNPALVQLTGYSEDELLGRDETLFLGVEGDEEALDSLRGAKAGGRAITVELRCRRKDDTLFLAEVTLAPATDDYGERHSMALILTDTTSKHRLKSLEASESGSRPRSPDDDFRFTANLIHELRTPLNAIIGFADVLHSEIFGPLPHDKYREYSVDILESGRHLLELVNEILDLSKADAGRLELSEGPVDLVSAVQSSVKMIEQTAEGARVEVSVAIADDLPHLHADERRVRQILINLLANAVKFTPPGGEVLLTADRDPDGGLFVSVLDTGIGMSAEDLSIAVVPFGQVGTRGKDAGQGTGLGLPLTQKLLEAHGGSLEILSSCGQGTIMVGRFPAARIVE